MTTMRSDVTATGDTMMAIALDLTLAAAAMEVAPAVWVKLLFSWSQGNATAVNGAAGDWAAAAAKVSDAANALGQAVSGISPADWTAGDRVRYEKAVEEARRQLDDVRGFLDTAGRALETVAEALVVYDLFAVEVSTVLVWLGVTIVASEATVAGAADVPGLEAVAWAVFGAVTAATVALAAVGTMAGGVLQSAALLAARAESGDGDAGAYRELAHGEEVGAAAAYANLGQDAINAGIDYAARDSGIAQVRKGLGLAKKGEKDKNGYVGVSGVDLDADRSWDRTWNVGAGAQYGNASAGVHASYGDRGLERVDESASYQVAPGVQASASHSVGVDRHGDLHETVSLSGTAQGPDGSAEGALTGHRDIGEDGESYRGDAAGHVTDRHGNVTWSGNRSTGELPIADVPTSDPPD